MNKLNAYGMIALAGWVAAAGAPAASGISEELRLAIQRDVEAVEKDGARMGDVMAALREIGASYLPEIVAPVDVDKYQSPDRRRWMAGAYLMDLTYAATFAQNEPAARYGQAVYRLLDLLGFPQPDMEQRYREALGQIDLPGGDERLKQLLKEQDRDAAWQEMIRTGDGVELVVDGLYGFLIEGLYLTSELCALSNYDPSSMMYVAYIRDSFKAYKELLYRLGDSPELATTIERHDRLNLLTSFLVILGDLPQVGPEQLEALRPAIAKARQEIVR